MCLSQPPLNAQQQDTKVIANSFLGVLRKYFGRSSFLHVVFFFVVVVLGKPPKKVLLLCLLFCCCGTD